MNKQAALLAAEARVEESLQRFLGRVMRRALLGVVMLASAMPLLARAENAIKAVSGSVQGGSEVIRIDLVEPLTEVPSGFSIQTPARIALDFQGVSNAIGRSAVEINLGNMRSANVVRQVIEPGWCSI